MRADFLKTALLLLTWLGVGSLPTAVLGQDKEPKLTMRVEPAMTAKVLNVLDIRPNAATATAFYLENLNEDVPNNAVIKLVQIVAGEPRIIGQAKLNPAGKNGPLVFAKPKDAKDTPEKIDLLGPPFTLQFCLEAGNKKLFEKTFDLRIRPGRDLISVEASDYDKSTRRLRIKIKLNETVGAKGLPVELVLGPAFKESKKGTFKQILTVPNQMVELLADDLEFLPGVNPAEGRVCLTVNGYERAYTYEATLRDTGSLSEVPFDREIGARLRTPAYALPNEKFKIGLELSGAMDAGQLEVGVDRTGKKDPEQFQVQTLPSLRRQKVQMSVSPKGDLVWHAEVSDWQPEFDVSGVFGKVWFRVRVLDGKSELKVVRARGAKTGEAKLEEDPDFDKSLFARVILDGTPPEDVKFVDLKTEWERGKPLPVEATVAARAPDRLAPIEKVLFFRGKMPADGKISPDNELALGEFDPKTKTWKAEIPAQDKESLELNVKFITATGLAATALKPSYIFYKAPSPVKAAKIRGTVTYGDRPQPNMTVTLSDEKGKAKDKTKTNDKGEYVFEKVSPGNYAVWSVRNFPALVGRVNIEVPEGQALVDNVAIRMQAK